MSVFSKFSPRLQEAIVARLGWTSLRPVQEQAGEALLAGSNAVILAPTAGGKTEASMFPTLSQLVDEQPSAVGAIYIAPIKALLNNQSERLDLYTEMVGLNRFVWHGDTNSAARKKFLKEPAELLMTTPESLEVMLVSQRVNEGKLFADLRVVIIDEVHAIAGSDRGAHLMSVLERINRYSKNDIQRIGLSATVGNPDAILEWLQGSSERSGIVVDPPKKPAKRELLITHQEGVAQIARDAASVAQGCKSLFFCQSRAMTETVAESMRRSGTEVFVHHSAVSKEERQLAEENFHTGSDACIVCTSTLELGIDVGDLDKVMQAEAPDSVGSFLQRMGRTGRREGQSANTTFFCESSEQVLQAIALIELAKSGWVENVNVSRRCWPVIIHQLLAMALAGNGIAIEAAWHHLHQILDFSEITREEFNGLLEHMIEDESLIETEGQLVLGPTAERRFGRRNFMELFAVFTSPRNYKVEDLGGSPLGTLSQDFVDRLVEDVSSFLLAGRAWAVSMIRHDERRVIVVPAPRGRQPSWGGFLPQFLGFDLCQAILGIIASTEDYAYLNPNARSELNAQRDELRGIVSPGTGGYDLVGDEFQWWTFAGGRINSTLRHALSIVNPDWIIIPDNFVVKIRGNVTSASCLEAIQQISQPEFWDDNETWQHVTAGLPNYRLSKFQPLMPPWVEQEIVGDYLLDFRGARQWLNNEQDTTI